MWMKQLVQTSADKLGEIADRGRQSSFGGLYPAQPPERGQESGAGPAVTHRTRTPEAIRDRLRLRDR
jgi:hypothetical protein